MTTGGVQKVAVLTAPGISVTPANTGTFTQTSVAQNAASVTIKAANVNRKGLWVFNNSTADLYLSLSTPATVASTHFVKIPAGGFWEMPQVFYNGIVYGIWSAAGAGAAKIVELG